MKSQRMIAFLVFIIMFSFSVPEISASSGMSIKVDYATVESGKSISVPIRVLNNTGICGATLSIHYDERLILTDIEKGTALSSLTMTKPGDFTANPINLVFDGMEEDRSDGIIAYLCFEAMTDGGTYDISITYTDGDIVNGDLEALDVEMINGQVKVESSDDNVDDKGDVESGVNHDGPIITIGEVTAQPEESIDVPVYISGNTGICGATLRITYDESLTLTQITQGDALSELSMTKPGNLTANPFNLVFDGIEQDNTNGLFFTLTFTAPQEKGVYDITATYEDGDIVNGDLMPVEVLIEKGGIMVGAENIEVTVGDKIVDLQVVNETNGNILVAFYNGLGRMTSVKIYELNGSEIAADADPNAAYAKVFCWSDALTPLCDAQKITLK